MLWGLITVIFWLTTPVNADPEAEACINKINELWRMEAVVKERWD